VLKETPALRVEYFEVANPATMQAVAEISGPVRVVAAAWLGTTRLIDNVLVP
jgi:pantothenate synthetase